jgi:protein-tyrosine-phosphatase
MISENPELMLKNGSESIQEPALAHGPEQTSRSRLARGFRAMTKKLLPEVIAREVQRYRVFNRTERPIYLRKRVLNGIGIDRPTILPFPEMTRSVLFVCLGNIIRSPMCEAMLIRNLAGLADVRVAVSSAGLHALPGRPAHPWAVAAAQDFAISLEGHRARLLTDRMVNEADAIFAMDYQNQVELLSGWPGAGKKIHMLSGYAPRNYRLVEIPDPYYLGRHETISCCQVLKTCIDALAHHLSQGSRTRSESLS